MTKKSGDNIQSVQFLRGLACVMVLLVHSVSTGEYFPNTHILYDICMKGWVSVNIFFTLSGFIIPYSMYKSSYVIGDIYQFFAKRLVRVEPPYIVSIVMVLMLNFINTITPWYQGPSFTIDWPNVLGHLGYFNSFTRKPWLNWAYWTLAIEFQFYLMIALFYPLLVHKKKVILYGTFLALTACTLINFPFTMPFEPFSIHSGYINSQGVYEGGSDSSTQILPFLPFFLIGIAYFLFRVRIVQIKGFIFMTVVSLLMTYYRHGIPLTFVSLGTIAILHYMKRVPKLWLWFGTISYSLYLTHDVLLARFQAVIERYVHINVIIVWAISILLCFLVGHIYFVLVERPFLNLSKKIGYQHRGKKLPPEPEIVPGEKDVVGQ